MQRPLCFHAQRTRPHMLRRLIWSVCASRSDSERQPFCIISLQSRLVILSNNKLLSVVGPGSQHLPAERRMFGWQHLAAERRMKKGDGFAEEP